MNTYEITYKDALWRQTYYVSARDAKTAITKVAKYRKQHTLVCGELIGVEKLDAAIVT